MKLWIKDSRGKRSVSLTLLVTATFLMIGTHIAVVMDVVKSAGIAEEMFYAACATYFGRRVKFGDKEIDK